MGEDYQMRRDVLGVPVIDIDSLMACETDAEVQAMANDDALFQAMFEKVEAAATEWGFFYVSNHGMSDGELRKFQSSMRSFFRLPKDVKRRIKRTAVNSRGYFDDEFTKNKLDWKEGLDFAGRQEDVPACEQVYKRMGDDENQWLSDEMLPYFRENMQTYFESVEHIARRLMMLFAVALGEKVTLFDKYFHSRNPSGELKGTSSSFLRLNYYPVAPDPESTMAVHHHTDAGALTVLLQDDDVASLQVFHRGTEKWCLIPPRKGTFVINIGDMLQIWSNDRFTAPLHRVLASSRSERFSAPFFYNPSYDALVEPLGVSDVSDDRPHYSPLKWYDFRLQRFQGDYADTGEEIQINQFRV